MNGATLHDAWSRARMVAQAGREYVRLVGDAWRAWIYGAVLAAALLGGSAALGVEIPPWALLAAAVGVLAGVQFPAFFRVREQRDSFHRAGERQRCLDAIAALRSKEAALKTRPVGSHEECLRWRAELVALRGEIHAKIAAGISRAEAETFHMIGNLAHRATGGLNDEHNLLLAVAARDLDHLAELIHGYARFEKD